MDTGSSTSKQPRSRSRDRETKHSKRHSREDRSEGQAEPRADESEAVHRRHKRRGDELDARESRSEDKRRRRDKRAERHSSNKGKKRDVGGLAVVDDDVEEDEWVEKDADTEQSLVGVPTPASLLLRSNPSDNPNAAQLPPSIPFDSTTSSRDQQREDWMMDPTCISAPGVRYDDKNQGARESGEETRGVRSARVDLRDLGTPIKGSTGEFTSGGPNDVYGEEDQAGKSLDGDEDFFSGMGTFERVKKAPKEKPDPSKLVIARKYELNTQLLEGKPLEDYTETEKKKVVPGSAGSQWRMMKLRRVYEQADEESRSIKEVALERYGNMEDFDEAREERQVLDDRENRRSARRGGDFSGGGPAALSRNNSGYNTPGGKSDGSGSPAGNTNNSARRYVFTTDEAVESRPSSRAGFKRPGENSGEIVGDGLRRSDSMPGLNGDTSTPTQPGRSSGRFDQSAPSTPIPSVLTPHHLLRNPLSSQAVPTVPNNQSKRPSDITASTPPLSANELNKLQAKVLRAKLTGNPKAVELQAEYDAQVARGNSSSGQTRGGGDAGPGLWEGNKLRVQGQQGRNLDGGSDVQVLPTLDGQGRLYDVGTGLAEQVILPGNRKPNTNKFETRDREGNLLRINADDDTLSLGELVRQERFSGGSKSQKDMDGEMAMAIANDTKYQADLDYVDDNVERLARRKVKSTDAKKAFAVQDYARTKKALDTCAFCFNPEDGSPPKAAIVALGRRTYLSCTIQEELVDGHCLIVPMQHCLSTLELEDDDWDEIKNHMKCLMRMFAEQNKGVIFFETVMSLSHQKHTFIECIPLPAGPFADAPAYFRESILSAESEWSQNRKLIDFSARPGGFRRSMVPNLPYFMVMWDYKGEKGWGHIIEGTGDAPGSKGVDGEDEGIIDEGDKGNDGGVFPRYFAAEIIGNILDLEPRKWRKPRRADFKRNKERAAKLGNSFQRYNWTLDLAKEDAGS